MFDEFLTTPKRFMTLYLTLEHLKYCLNSSKVDTETMLPFEGFLIFDHKII